MPRPHSLLAVLTPDERHKFLPESVFSELRDSATDFHLLDPSGMTAEAFGREVVALDP